jgi:hypothetical protein
MVIGEAEIDGGNAAGRQFIGGDAEGAQRHIGIGIFDGQIVGALHRFIILLQCHQTARHRAGILGAVPITKRMR